jgi:hypothetical protein
VGSAYIDQYNSILCIRMGEHGYTSICRYVDEWGGDLLTVEECVDVSDEFPSFQ